MASVYRGYDLRLERPIALKVMRPDLARDLDFVSRFQREARSAAALSDPHVVSVFDQGEDDGLVYLVMELVPGANLRDIIHQQAPLSIRRATHLIDEILQALSAAHRGGLIHRDIKPENVLTDLDGSVKVADFGLARAVTAGTMSRTSDVMWGTAAYLSPEQVQHGRADARTDVYAVGLVLYELLTGVKAFAGDSPIHVAFQHVHGSVPAVAAESPNVPGEIDALIAMATATDPDDRPEDAMALRAALARVVTALSDEELDGPMVTKKPIDRDKGGRSGSASAADGMDATRPVRQATAVVPLEATPRADGNFARTTGNRTPKPAKAKPVTAKRPALTPAAPRRRRVGALLAVLLLIIGVGGGGAAAWYFTAGPGNNSAMPDVTGQSEGEAVAALQQVELDSQTTPEFSETVPDGVVISTSKQVGASVRHGTAVDLVVSQGPERYAVPNLANLTVAEARTALEDQTLSLGEVSQEFSSTVPVELVLSSAPTPQDDPVPPGTAVDLVVSAGPEPVDIPDVTGSTQSDAEQTLTDAGLEAAVESEAVNDPDVPEGSVVSQDPSSGQALPGETVTLTLSQGPVLVTMPNVITMQYTEAKPLLEDLGLVVVKEDIAQAFFGTVRFQSVDEGEEVPEGTSVTLSVL